MSKVSKTAVAAPGHSPATLAFAKKVVALRDSGMSWEAVAAKVGVAYGANGSSKLRRAYTIGGGATVGVRKNAAAKSAPKVTAKRTPRGAKVTGVSAKPRTRGQRKVASETATPAERRRARQAEAAKAAKAAK